MHAFKFISEPCEIYLSLHGSHDVLALVYEAYSGGSPYCMPLSSDAVYGMAINVVWRCAKPLTRASPLPPASLPRAVCTRRSWGGTVAGHGRRPGGHRANMWSAALPRARGGSRHHIPRRAGG